MLNRPLFAVLATLAASLCAAATTHAQTVITALPYTITAGGTYVLNNNLSSNATSGSLIAINASNVTIDFQNHYIAGPPNVTSSGLIGIAATERSNLTIRNGTIAYCQVGMEITGNNTATTNNVDQQITNMRITYSYEVGIDLAYAPSSVISDCLVSQTGFDTSTGVAIGINVTGGGIVVQGCTISNVIAGPSAAANTFAISSDAGSFTRQCQLINANFGIAGGVYQDNLASACTTAFDGGTNGGGNTSDGTSATNTIAPRASSKVSLRPLRN